MFNHPLYVENFLLLEHSKEPKDDYKNDDGAKTTAAQFHGSVSGKCSLDQFVHVKLILF
jgi:hypothetical protein